MNQESHEKISCLCKKRGFALTIFDDHYSFFNKDDSTMVHLFIDNECLVGNYSEKKCKIPQKYKKLGYQKSINKYQKNKDSVYISNAEGDFYDKYQQRHESKNRNLLVVRIPYIQALDKNIAFRTIKQLEVEKKHKVFMVQYIGYPEVEIERIKRGSCGWGCCGLGSVVRFNIIETTYDKKQRKYIHYVKEKGHDDYE